MLRFALVATLLAAAAASPAHAQIAAAICKPLPSPDLPPNSVSVRVVAGSPSSPVIGTDVTLLVNDTPRTARTDSAGRAHFKDLPPGAKLKTKVVDEDKKEVICEEFQLPTDSGARLMMTTRPWNPGAGGGGAPMAGGAMPNPRQMSGEPRPEQADPPGSLTVRLSYDDFKDAPPVDVPVVLVGYSADGRVTSATRKSDKDGRATFDGLDRSGATAYYAMTQLPRGTGVDRLISTPATLDPRTGVRLILSAEKRASTEPPVDDLAKLEKQEGAPGAGKVLVALEGGPDSSSDVLLIDAETKLVIGRAKPETGPPDPQDIQAAAQFNAKPDVPVGMLRVRVHGGSGNDEAIANVGVRLILASAQDPGTDDAEHKTNDNGIVELANPSKQPLTAVITVNGKKLRSKPFDLTQSGGELEVEARWQEVGRPQVTFDLVPRAGQVVYAETNMHGNQYRSLPFQPLIDRGTRISLFIFPRVLFTFSLTSRIDDEYLGVNGRFEISNNAWAPYVGGSDGLLLPLPRGFTGGIIAEQDQDDVAVVPGEGFRLIHPIPPGTRAFHGAFSLPVKAGTVSWAMDLPFGAFNSGMELLQVPGMTVKTPQGVEGRTVTVAQGTFFTLPQIQILPKQSMVMTIEGLPAQPAWRVWVPRVVGVLVVFTMLGGLYFALRRKRPDPAIEHKRQKLLDELVQLQKSGKHEQRREQLISELEQLWE